MMRNISVLVFAVLFSLPVFASQVTKVKGTNALLDLAGDSANVGDRFYAVGADGKRKAILEVAKVKGDKAIAKILKGRADVGMTLEHRQDTGGGGGATNAQQMHAKSSGSRSRSFWGGMVGYSRDSMTVQVNSGVTAGTVVGTPTLTGSSFSGMAFFDYELFPQIWFRGLGGVEGFSVTGQSICGTGNNAACTANIYYLSGDFLGRYIFSMGNFRPWLGGGIALMFPASKTATALQPSSISNTSVLQVSGGFDWFISPRTFIPISIEYGLLPKSNEVDATWMEFRIGLGIPFQ